MPSATLRPNGNYSAQWHPNMYTNYQAVGDGADGSYVYWNGTGEGGPAQDLYYMADLPGSAATVSNVNVYGRANQDPGGSGYFFTNPYTVGVGSGPPQVRMEGSTVVSTYGGASTVAPDGGAWTVSKINNVLMILYTTLSVTAYVRDVWMTLDYIEGGPIFIPIWMLLPGVFGGAGLIFRELQEMVKLIARKKEIIYKPEEVELAWREYKDGIVRRKTWLMPGRSLVGC